MSKKSAGLLLFRTASGAVEVLLVHPGGPFWSKKDEGAWSIPNGEFSDDEDPLNAAVREVKEELGEAVTGDFIALQWYRPRNPLRRSRHCMTQAMLKTCKPRAIEPALAGLA